jgi:simple sugar transport system permease protein
MRQRLRPLWRPSRGLAFVYAALGLVVLAALVRLITGVSELTSPGTIAAALTLAVPIGMAGLGGLWSERSGVVNIGLEGMMILGTFGAGWAGYQWGPWGALLVAVAFGALGGLVLALATVTFGVGQIVAGVAINILALGVTQFLANIWFAHIPGAGPQNSPAIPKLGTISIGFISDPSSQIAGQGWFVISDLAAIVAGITRNLSYLTVVAVALLVLTRLILWRTPFGLRLRSCGEAPYAAATLGVDVVLHRYVAVVASGALAGFGGAYLAMVAAVGYRDGQTGGRGYIGLAAMIFGNWRPGGLAGCAALFGYVDGLQLRSVDGVRALLVLTAMLLLIYGAVRLYRGQRLGGGLPIILAIGLVILFTRTAELPSQVAFATPYVATLLVLSLTSQRLRMPAADGLPYLKGEEH